MYYIEKTVVISAAHHLEGYNGACRNVHGHNWKVTVFCKGEELDEIGMLVDFRKISQAVKLLGDHTDLNPAPCKSCGHRETVSKHFCIINPTAENIAKWICDRISLCYKVKVEETEGSVCTYVQEQKKPA